MHRDLVLAAGADLHGPGDFVIQRSPVIKVGAVGELVGTLDAAVGHAIARGDLRPLGIRMGDHKRPVVLAQFDEHGFLPLLHLTSQLRGHLGLFLADVLTLPRIRHHVEELACVPQAISLRARAALALPAIHNRAIGPLHLFPEQVRFEAAAVERLLAGHRNARAIGQRGEQIHDRGDGLYKSALRNARRPADDQRRPHAAFIRRSLAPFHAAIPTHAVRAVVMKEQHDGVLGHAELIKLLEQSTDVPVDVLAHRQSTAQMLQIFPTRIADAQLALLVLKLVPPAIRHLHRRVRRVVR